jgi:hypothetical protein
MGTRTQIKVLLILGVASLLLLIQQMTFGVWEPVRVLTFSGGGRVQVTATRDWPGTAVLFLAQMMLLGALRKNCDAWTCTCAIVCGLVGLFYVGVLYKGLGGSIIGPVDYPWQENRLLVLRHEVALMSGKGDDSYPV